MVTTHASEMFLDSPCCTNYADFNSCLIIGGAGMLGRALINLLLREGKEIRVFDLELVQIPKVESIQGDIRDFSAVLDACKNVDVVFHSAAAVWNPLTPVQIFDDVNIKGTNNVIKACIQQNISKLIYTSTLDVVVDGAKPITMGDERLPYPPKLPKDPYSRTKIIAEKNILDANSPTLKTCALRPVGMYGPFDKYHVPNILKMAKKGNKFRLGDGSAKFSHVYATNAAYAHLLAAKHLNDGSPVCGDAYFVCDHQPADNLFDFMEPFLECIDLPVPTRKIPYKLAYFLASISEKVVPRSNFNRFSVIQTCVDHTFSSAKAEQEFCYRPIISKEDAIQETIEWVKETWQK